MATSLNADDLMSEPDQDVFDSLRKDNLLALSLYLNLNVKKSWRKIGIQIGWLCLTSHRQRGHLETAPQFTVPCEGREAR